MCSKFYHFITILCFLLNIFLYLGLSGFINLSSKPKSSVKNIDPVKQYGFLFTYFLYFLKMLTFLQIPLIICNMIGLFYFDTFPKSPVLRSSLLFGPFVCFRVVTKGKYSDLVKNTVQRNIETCVKLGLSNFVFEVASDSPIGIVKSAQVREIVVPEEYHTKKGTLYKARALQYCLEEEVNILSDNDWIIHLDEETVMTENSLIGIINFINDGQYEFGQGVITYASDVIGCWITSLADSIRVGIDYGILRMAMGILHRPVFSWKGSFIVANAGAERKITFDFGPDGSIAEDCFFALTAWKEGFKFGFVEGEMWERSTFSVIDFIRQRKRWVQGIYKVTRSKKIPFQYKIGIIIVMINWVALPLLTLNIVMIPLFSLPTYKTVNLVFSLSSACGLGIFTFGAVKSFSQRRNICFYVSLLFLIPLIAPLAGIFESIAVVWAFLTLHRIEFYIVKKDSQVKSLISHV